MSQRETMQRAIDLLEAVRNGSIKPKFENRIPANSRSIKKEQPHDVSTFGTDLRAQSKKKSAVRCRAVTASGISAN